MSDTVYTKARREAQQSLGLPPELGACREVGDALRLDLDIPAARRTWLEALTGKQRASIADASARLLETVGRGPGPMDASELHDVVRARDMAQSVRCALARAEIERVPLAAEIERDLKRKRPRAVALDSAAALELAAALERLDSTTAKLDRSLATSLSARRAAELLGERAPLLRGLDWTRALADPDGTASDDPSVAWAFPPGELPHQLAPSVDVVARYIEQGVGSLAVERFAARNHGFAVELEAQIRAAFAMQDPVAWMPRAWLHRRADVGDRKVGWAALSDRAAEASIIELGSLAPLDVRAQLFLRAGQIELRIYDDGPRLTTVEFEGVTGLYADGLWSVTLKRPPGNLRLVLRDASGHIFDEVLPL